YAIAPILFLYVKSYTHDKRTVTSSDLFHFIPALVILLVSLPFMLQPASKKIEIIDSLYQGLTLFTVLVAIAMTAFLVYTVILIIKVARVFHSENPLHMRLLRVFILFFSWIILSIFKIIGIARDMELMWRIVHVIVSVEIIILYFLLQRIPVLLGYGNLSVQKNREKSRSLIDSLDTDGLKKQIELMMEEEKLFCDEDLTLNRFAHALEITPHQLSAFLNETFGKNFNAFINGYRIRYACSLLDGDSDASTLSVAFACGFNSYSAFFSAFKREEGCSPGSYRGRHETKKRGA
ncbi:MAG: helix-turn-helix domain-containing protein, partial [Spirochaetota bacterium]